MLDGPNFSNLVETSVCLKSNLALCQINYFYLGKINTVCADLLTQHFWTDRVFSAALSSRDKDGCPYVKAIKISSLYLWLTAFWRSLLLFLIMEHSASISSATTNDPKTDSLKSTMSPYKESSSNYLLLNIDRADRCWAGHKSSDKQELANDVFLKLRGMGQGDNQPFSGFLLQCNGEKFCSKEKNVAGKSVLLQHRMWMSEFKCHYQRI